MHRAQTGLAGQIAATTFLMLQHSFLIVRRHSENLFNFGLLESRKYLKIGESKEWYVMIPNA